MKQLIEVDICGGTVTLIAELAMVNQKGLRAKVAFLTGADYNLSTSVSTHISLMVVVLLILVGNMANRVASRGFWCHLMSSSSYRSNPWDMYVC